MLALLVLLAMKRIHSWWRSPPQSTDRCRVARSSSFNNTSWCLLMGRQIGMRIRSWSCASTTSAIPIFAAGWGLESLGLGSHGATDLGLGLCRPCGHSRRTLNYTAPPVQFPRLSRSVRHGRTKPPQWQSHTRRFAAELSSASLSTQAATRAFTTSSRPSPLAWKSAVLPLPFLSSGDEEGAPSWPRRLTPRTFVLFVRLYVIKW
jgi:hypothetical protein